MDPQFIDRFRHALNNEVAGRLLIRYFVSKGYENFDSLMYPALLQDMPYAIPEMVDKIEILPHTRSLDPMQDLAELGWNLFVLGSHRMYLGETYHMGLKQLALQLQQGQVLSEDRSATRQTTPRRMINFISRVLVTHRSGHICLTPRTAPLAVQRPYGGAAHMSQQFYGRVGGFA